MFRDGGAHGLEWGYVAYVENFLGTRTECYMRLDSNRTLKRAKFVIDLYANDSELSIPDVRRLVIARYKTSMNYNLIKRYRDAVEDQRKLFAKKAAEQKMVAAALQAPVLMPAPVVAAPAAPPVAPPAAPVVTVVSPGTETPFVGMPPEFMEGLKLIKHASGGAVQVISEGGTVDVTCKLGTAPDGVFTM